MSFTHSHITDYPGQVLKLTWADPYQEEEKDYTMKKHFVSSFNVSKKFDTQAEAEDYTKKQMEQYSKSGMCNNDGVVYTAVAYVKFPTPAYEVVAIA